MFAKSRTPMDRKTNPGDLIKRTVAESMAGIVVTTRGATVPVTLYDGRCQLPDGTYWEVSDPALGYAARTRSITKFLTKAQHMFLETSYSLGDPTLGGHKSMKIGPRTAASHMKLLGTREGQQLYSSSRYTDVVREFWTPNPTGKPTFRVHEILDHWYIKSWFSTRKSGGPKEFKPWAGVLYGDHDIASMSLKELIAATLECGISNKGKKDELSLRLFEHLTNAIVSE